MIVNNHYNEEVEVIRVKRIKQPNSVYYFKVKAHMIDDATEYWNYEDFQQYNPDFNWDNNG